MRVGQGFLRAVSAAPRAFLMAKPEGNQEDPALPQRSVDILMSVKSQKSVNPLMSVKSQKSVDT